MAAAAITPTVVQKTYIPATGLTGTPIRLVEYFVKLTKVTQNDWLVGATYCSGTFLGVMEGYTIDSSGNGVPETTTYTASGTLVTMTSATVGTTYLRLLYQEA